MTTKTESRYNLSCSFNTKQYVSITLLDPCCRYQDR